MKVLILSDSHNNKKNLDRLVPIIKSSIDLIIHAGDNFRDSVYLHNETNVPVCAVRGNCDIENTDEDMIFELEGLKIFLTHGHRYGVKYGLNDLARFSNENNIDIAIFGHTHIKEHRVIGKTQFLNPGSLSQPRDGIEKSYVIMDINQEHYEYEYFTF